MPEARFSRSTTRRAVGAAAVLTLLAGAAGVQWIAPQLLNPATGSADSSQSSDPVALTQSSDPADATVLVTAPPAGLDGQPLQAGVDGQPLPPGPNAQPLPPGPNGQPQPPGPNAQAPLPPGTGNPIIGPGVTEPGVLFIATADAYGDFDISESIVLGADRDTLSLQVPDVTEAGLQFRKTRPKVNNVQASANGQALTIPGGTIKDPLELKVRSSNEFEIRYRIVGVTDRNQPVGPAVGALALMVADLDPDLPVAIVVVGSSVRSVNCPMLDASDQSCAAGSPPALQVAEPLPYSSAVVTVQHDVLRAPGGGP